MTLREGHQALDAQRLGRAAEALQLALLQSAPSEPGAEPVMSVFPAWPREWDASYELRARGAFVVSASIRQARIGPVELRSLAGAEARMRNPWGDAAVQVFRDGRRAETLEGALLVVATRAGETVRVLPRGGEPFNPGAPGAYRLDSAPAGATLGTNKINWVGDRAIRLYDVGRVP
jgi:hypothetical protein